MAWARAISFKSVYITRYCSMKVPISFRTLHAMADKNILVDSGAMDNFIHPKLLKRLGLGSQLLERPQKIWNIDGTTNKEGALTHCIDLEVHTGTRQEVMRFLMTDLGGEDLILGYMCHEKTVCGLAQLEPSVDTLGAGCVLLFCLLGWLTTSQFAVFL